MRRLWNIIAAHSPALLAVFVAVCVAALAVWWGALNQDEGWYLYAARLVGEGRLPYRDFFFTQGPVLPFLYSAMPIHGLLSGRLVTAGISLVATLLAMAFARGLVSPQRRGAVGLTVFALLSCNLYHAYFTAIPKTYAVGALFVMGGFLLLSRGWNFPAAMSFAFASGTRISLVLLLGVVGVWLLVTRFRRLDWLWFGIGGTLGLFLVYGLFALDETSLNGLLAAQTYHAGRGGFDAFFAVGSVSRLARGYLSLGAVMFAAAGFRAVRRTATETTAVQYARDLMWMAGLGFAAVFLLQMCAPFPYDDYAVPIMPILAVIISVWFVNGASEMPNAVRWFPVLVSGMCAFASPLMQDWMTNGQDRFWPRKKCASELSQIRSVAKAMETLDPGGEMLLTQDLYLAVEMGRKVPHGLEMGPFSYFPDLSTEDASAIHVVNGELMEGLLKSAPCRLAAVSGYGFAIESPKGTETPKDMQRRYVNLLEEGYRNILRIDDFGQNQTTLRVFRQKP